MLLNALNLCFLIQIINNVALKAVQKPEYYTYDGASPPLEYQAYQQPIENNIFNIPDLSKSEDPLDSIAQSDQHQNYDLEYNNNINTFLNFINIGPGENDLEKLDSKYQENQYNGEGFIELDTTKSVHKTEETKQTGSAKGETTESKVNLTNNTDVSTSKTSGIDINIDIVPNNTLSSVLGITNDVSISGVKLHTTIKQPTENEFQQTEDGSADDVEVIDLDISDLAEVGVKTLQNMIVVKTKEDDGTIAENTGIQIMSAEDRNLIKVKDSSFFDPNIRTFSFLPQLDDNAIPQKCITAMNESGNCRQIHQCMLTDVATSIRNFMGNVCTLAGGFVGICCPEFPVFTVRVNWGVKESFSNPVHPADFSEECGVGTNPRIVGGSEANKKAWPWMVALLNNKGEFFCGGCLINSLYVLTAAHCTFGAPKNEIIARLGEHNLTDKDGHDDYRVAEIKAHGEYTRFTLKNDIALLKLARPVIFNDFLRTLCLPKEQNDYVGKIATLAGWGYLEGGEEPSNVLQEASFPVIENLDCFKAHGVPVVKSLICAASPDSDKGACNGDSGGPLMLLDEDQRWKVIGIVSWGRRGCNPSYPTVYTRVTHYLDWIKKHSSD